MDRLHILSVKDNNGTYVHHIVPVAVYIYVKQLEMYINNPDVSSLLDTYKDRFKKEPRVSEGVGGNIG